jgi:hypothetical protein
MSAHLARSAVGSFIVAVSLAMARPAAAAESIRKTTDGVYGRFDGDLDISLAVGATLGPDGPSAAGVGRAIFLQTAGFYIAYTDVLGRDSAPLPRSLAFGVTVRPFFLPRWALDLEHGPAILDLTIDAISFDLGVLWPTNHRGAFAERPGMEAALGTEVPLFGSAHGPFLGARGALRWRAEELARQDDNRLQPVVFLTLAWHALIDANIVDAGDRVMR